MIKINVSRLREYKILESSILYEDLLDKDNSGDSDYFYGIINKIYVKNCKLWFEIFSLTSFKITEINVEIENISFYKENLNNGEFEINSAYEFKLYNMEQRIVDGVISIVDTDEISIHTIGHVRVSLYKDKSIEFILNTIIDCYKDDFLQELKCNKELMGILNIENNL